MAPKRHPRMAPEQHPSIRSWRRFLPLLGLVFLDQVTKALAYWCLSPNKETIPGAWMQFVLVINHLGLGSAASLLYVAKYAPASKGILSAALSYDLIAITLLVSARIRRLAPAAIVVAGIGIVILMRIGAQFIDTRYLPGQIDSIRFERISAMIFWIAVWILIRSPVWKMGALLFAAAGTGNALSLIFPPYGIIDFIWSSPVNSIFRLQVFNLADVMWISAFFVFAFALVQSAIRRFRPKAAGTAV